MSIEEKDIFCYLNSRLNEVFVDRFAMDFSKLTNEYKDYCLLGPEIRFGYIELLYLYFDIKHKMNIMIPEEPILSNRFTTYNNILRLIISCKVS